MIIINHREHFSRSCVCLAQKVCFWNYSKDPSVQLDNTKLMKMKLSKILETEYSVIS